MAQTKLSSLLEALANTVLGFIITMLVSPIIYPLFGHSFTTTQQVGITLAFTVISVARNYVMRRWFNAYIKAGAEQASKGLTA